MGREDPITPTVDIVGEALTPGRLDEDECCEGADGEPGCEVPGVVFADETRGVQTETGEGELIGVDLDEVPVLRAEPADEKEVQKADGAALHLSEQGFEDVGAEAVVLQADDDELDVAERLQGHVDHLSHDVSSARAS